MKTIFKKADRTARNTKSAPTPVRAMIHLRNRVAYAAAMEVLG